MAQRILVAMPVLPARSTIVGEVETHPEPSGTGESCLRPWHSGDAHRPEEASNRGRYRSGSRGRFGRISEEPDWYLAGNPIVPWRTASGNRIRFQCDSSGSPEHLLDPAYVWPRLSPFGPETVPLAYACAPLQPAASGVRKQPLRGPEGHHRAASMFGKSSRARAADRSRHGA